MRLRRRKRRDQPGELTVTLAFAGPDREVPILYLPYALSTDDRDLVDRWLREMMSEVQVHG